MLAPRRLLVPYTSTAYLYVLLTLRHSLERERGVGIDICSIRRGGKTNDTSIGGIDRYQGVAVFLHLPGTKLN